MRSSSRSFEILRFALGAILAPAAIAAVAIVACSSTSSNGSGTDGGATDAAFGDGGVADTPIDGLSPALNAAFAAGETAFNTEFAESDGLGPLYTEVSCGKCHALGARGPGSAQKMAVLDVDGSAPTSEQSLLPYGDTVHPHVVTDIPGARTPILAPDGGVSDHDGGTLQVLVTQRLGPPIYGRGYIEAIADSEIERMETEQSTRTDGIHGHANHIAFTSQPNPDPTYDSYQPGDMVTGRFGLKARIATLDEFSADALQGDIGITSPMRPTEFKNPDGVLDDLKVGVDVTADEMNARGNYPRLLAIPPRPLPDAGVASGLAWFEFCNCHVCHAESLKTRPDYPIPQLANIDAPVFTDILLHDMGDNLADDVSGANEGQAGPRDWRTAPLMGLRYNTKFLHDGRATTIKDAVMQHAGPGSEATKAVTCFNALNTDNLQSILDYLGGL